jgi:hypothetical protein
MHPLWQIVCVSVHGIGINWILFPQQIRARSTEFNTVNYTAYIQSISLKDKMNGEFILMDTLNVTSIAACIGVGVGIAYSLLNEKKRLDTRNQIITNLPMFVESDTEIRNCFLAFSEVKRPDRDSLDRSIRRCNTLLQMQSGIYKADPKTVSPCLSSTASKLEDDIFKYLEVFYYKSDIPVFGEVSGHVREFMPINPELKLVHETFRCAISGIVHNIHMIVKDAMDESMNDIQYKTIMAST